MVSKNIKAGYNKIQNTAEQHTAVQIFKLIPMPIMAEKIKNNIAKDETEENIKTV